MYTQKYDKKQLDNPYMYIYRVFFFHWYPPKKFKYEKPRLDESTLA